MTRNNKLNKSAKAYFKIVVRNISTIHGTVYFREKKGKYFILWCALMAANMLLTASFVIFVNQKYNGEHIVTEINANCEVSQVPFPSVTICNFNLVSENESRNIRRVLTHYKISDKQITQFLSFLPRLVVSLTNTSSSDVPNFENITTILKHLSYDIDILMQELHQKCENLLLYCSFNRKKQNCERIFNMIKTYDGHCCSFNYVGVDEESKPTLLDVDENVEYYDPNGDSSQNSKILATSESGRMSGLHVIFNVEPEDYPSWATTPFFGGKVLLSDPNDYPETTVLYEYFSPGEALDLKVVPMVYQADPNLQAVDPSIRNCWYPTEVELEHTGRYSFETCISECNMRTYLRICGCIPYKYPKEKNMRVCELADLACIRNVTVHISNKDRTCTPVCNVECNDKQYSMTSSSAPFLASTEPELPMGTNMSQVSSLRVYYQKSSCNCYKMKLLIDPNFIIATFGGVFSLGFGGSILTVIELVILILSTLYIICCNFILVHIRKLRCSFSKVKPLYVKY